MALTASNALYGHTDEVLSLSAEYGNHCMISGGKDDDLIVWGRDCKETSRWAGPSFLGGDDRALEGHSDCLRPDTPASWVSLTGALGKLLTMFQT